MSLIRAPVGPGQVLWKWRAATSWQNRFTVPPDLAARGPALAAWRHEPWSEPKKTEDNQVELKQWKWVVEIGKAMAMSFHQVHIWVGVFIYIYIRQYIYILIQSIPFRKKNKTCRMNKNAIISHAKKPARLTFFVFPGVWNITYRVSWLRISRPFDRTLFLLSRIGIINAFHLGSASGDPTGKSPCGHDCCALT